jgi:uncharacterized repeat protein (TIGR01451 family)
MNRRLWHSLSVVALSFIFVLMIVGLVGAQMPMQESAWTAVPVQASVIEREMHDALLPTAGAPTANAPAASAPVTRPIIYRPIADVQQAIHGSTRQPLGQMPQMAQLDAFAQAQSLPSFMSRFKNQAETAPSAASRAQRVDIPPESRGPTPEPARLTMAERPVVPLAPEVGVWKWTPPGYARPGGVFNYGVWYQNNGDSVANDVLIVDTLPVSTTWAGDDSGFTPELGAGGVITWHVSDLTPGEGRLFVVTLNVLDTIPTGAGSLSANCLAISTATPGDYDPGNDTACTNPIDVWNGDVEIGVDKWPDLNDPAPGQEFEYTVQVCNRRSADAGPVWFTDTLPLSTTFVSWSNNNPWAIGWTEVVTTGEQVVLKTPGFAGYGFCDDVQLRLRLDSAVPLGTVLRNAVILTIPDDVDLSNNQDTDTDARAGVPRYDLRADKNTNSGSLVPGGWVDYHIGYWNQGNSAVHAWLTDTLPAGTSYQIGSAREQNGGPAFPPITITDDYVVWDLGVIGVNQGYGLDFTVDISNSVAATSVITNCATIGIAQTDDQLANNTACVAEPIFDHGPNLRVRKNSWWNGDNQLGYDVRFENVGDVAVALMRLTDTYPLATVVQPGSVGWDGWLNATFTDNYTDGQLILEVPDFQPGWSAGFWFNSDLNDPNARPTWYTNTVEIGPADAYPADNTAFTVNVKAEVERAELWVGSAGYNMWGRAAPDAPITVTTALNQYVGQTNGGGDWNIDNIEALVPGATITVTAGGGVMPLVITIPAPFTAYASSITDTVWGQIDALDHAPIRVELYGFGGKDAQTDGSGVYHVTWNDVPRGAGGHVRYETTMGYAQVVMHRRFQAPDLVFVMSYGDDWIEGNYEAGHTIWITVTDGAGVVKATMVDTTTVVPWWNGGTGFSTNIGNWLPGQPDILPGDWVFGAVDTGYTTSMRIGLVTGNLDTNNNRITGTVTANWFATLLNAQCWVDGTNNTNQSFLIDPNGGSYACDFAFYDVQPNESVSVQYQEPDGDWVRNTFREPDVSVDKWNTGGHARPGGVVVYGLSYRNNGGDAAHVFLTDTLPLYTTYAADTSSITPEIGAEGVITWVLGALPRNANRNFVLTLNVSDTTPTGNGVIAANCAGITAPGAVDPNEGDNWRCTGAVDVWDDEVEIGIDKWPNPTDPAPGQEFTYDLRVCNNRGAAAGPVRLTDTLPLSTTFVSWNNQNPWNVGWTEVVTTGNQIVWQTAGLPGNMCDDVYLRLLLDAATPIGTVLVNVADVAAEGDVYAGNDRRVNTDAHAGTPRYDLRLDKDVNNGVLVPGGWINYHVSYNNQSNSVVHAWVTDTLPSGTAYQAGSAREQNGGPPWPPAIVTDEYVVWDLGVLAVGEGFGFDFSIDISNTLTPGTVLTNCASIGSLYLEDTPWDNTDCVVQTIAASGPNLRVQKWSHWNGNAQLGYDLKFENIGDVTLGDVWVTDTLPAATTWDGGWGMDFDWGRLISSTQSSSQLRWQFAQLNPGDAGWLHFNANLDDWTVRPVWYTNTAEIDTPIGDSTPDDNTAVTVNVQGEVDRAELWVGNADYNMWGSAAPNAPITVTTALNQYVGQANGGGDWNIDNIELLEPGATITVTAGNGLLPLVITIPAPFTAYVSSITDTVWGQIDALDHAQIRVELYGFGGKDGQTDGSGAYSVTWNDVPRGAEGHVRYETTMSYAQVVMHRRFKAPDLILGVDSTHDWVETNYESGHTIWITVTDSAGVVKATMVDTTTVVPWWNGGTGFSTNMGNWIPGQPDIVSGDWVYGALDNGYTSSVRVGTITGNLNVADDSITGTVTAAWFAQVLNAQCWIDGVNNINQNFTVYSVGGAYACDFTSVWNLVPGETVSVQYWEPDGDYVLAAFREPAPDLNVWKWVEGNSEIGAGNLIVFGVQYQNNGDAAGPALLTDTLPASTSYVTDTSGFPASVNGNMITWDLGTVEPYTISHRFQVVVSQTANVSDTLNNAIDISAPYDNNPGNNHAEAVVHIQEAGQPDLRIDKGASPGDPTPGQLFRYDLNYGNNSSHASGQACISDTLPLSTSLVSWRSNNGYNLWTQVSLIDRQLTLCAPVIPGNSGDQIQLTVLLDASVPIGMQLVNTVEITTANDSDLNNNYFVNDWTWASPQRYGVSINKNWGHGSLAPGQHVNYWLHFNNSGNMIAPDVVLTDVLPAGVIFVAATRDVGQGNEVPYPPTSIEGEMLRWDIDQMTVAENQNVRIELALPPTLTTGAVLTNCATIATSAIETDPYDNASCTTDTVYPAGPNLRVVKYANWNNPNRVRYDVEIANIGSQTINNVHITDILPISMSVSWWGIDFWEQWTGNQSGNQLTLTLTRLEPSWTTWLHIDADVPNGIPNGTFFTNTAQIDVPPGDVNPQDNTSVNVIATGPDLTMSKWQSGGRAAPGQLLTYTLHFKNDSQWWTTGNVWITDTLPVGVQFVSAQLRDCWDRLFCDQPPANVSGRTLTWVYGQWGNGWWDDLIVTVHVTDTVGLTNWLTNTAQIATTDPANDVEPNTANNTSVLVTPLAHPQFEIGKVAETNRVAGTVVTYTLTVTNVGTSAGTDIVVLDQVPANVTFGGSDGTFDNGVITWTLPNLAPQSLHRQAQPASHTLTVVPSRVYVPIVIWTLFSYNVWFSSTLSCTAGNTVANVEYRVASSAQGVTTSNGLPVSFGIEAPAIDANFSHAPDPVLAGQSVAFTGTASTNGTPLSYVWNFGDGAQATGLNATHTYSRDGVYTAVFTATDMCGFTVVHTSMVTVNAPTINANFTQSASSIVVGSSVRFTDTSTTNGSNIAGWRWNFGDGGVSSAQNPTHTYNTVGVYNVTLLITDSLGYTATHTIANAVNVVTGCTPVTSADFAFTPLKPLLRATVTFTATAQPISATLPITYAWNFGDGSTAALTTAVTQHTYQVTGTRAVTLTVSNACTLPGVAVSRAVTVVPYQVYLPLMRRQ